MAQFAFRSTHNALWRIAALAVFVALTLPAYGQFGRGRGRGPTGPPPPPKEQAPIDLTGYWVPLITEDWLYRMVTPEKGDFTSIPLNQKGREVGNEWDPSEKNSCKAYGPPGEMRLPLRLHIEWVGDDELMLETDAGEQTRHFMFKAPANEPPPSRQGTSVASWDGLPRGRGTFGIPAGLTGSTESVGPDGKKPIRPGALKVVTNNMTPGYLRKNGVPYSAEATVTEYYDIVHEPNGDEYLIVSSVVDDPMYLNQPWRTSTHYKREPDGSNFAPSPCNE